MKKIALFFVAFLALSFSCTKESPLSAGSDLVVVRAYLFAGEPVTDIQITGTLPLGSEETEAPPINDAQVALIKDGRQYDLTLSPGDSGYYHYTGNDLLVEQGDVFEIDVVHNDKVATGKAVVPAPPEDLALSSTTLYIPTEITFPFDPALDSTSSITVSWKRDSTSLFYVVVENVEENPDSIASFGGFRGGMGGSRRFMSTPTSQNEYRIQRFSLSYYGKHTVRIYRVNQEYADLYGSRLQDSRDLNEPLTNIENGLGVFSAFNSVKAEFTVVQQE